MTHADEVLRSFDTLQTWKRKDERAPHKPLLVLLALGRLQAGEERLMRFISIEENLSSLLQEFGPPRHSFHPEYPFWRLQRDGVWEVESNIPLKRRRSNSDPLKSELRAHDARGGIKVDLFRTLQEHPEIVRAVAQQLLDSHFPSSLHHAISSAVGLDLEGRTRQVKRDSSFRREVVAAWGHRCGFCGFDVKLDHIDLALEAAHIKWVQAGGPDSVANGISCCAIHHQALDAGAVGIDRDLRIMVSAEIHGGSSLATHFTSLKGHRLLLPSRSIAYPKDEYVKWHFSQVFKGSPRD